jgi:N-acetylneuraminic acid mutarotase
MKKQLLLFVLLISFCAANGQAWIQRTNYGSTGRHRGSGFAIGNKGYIGLGHVNGANVNVIYKDWWEYDPSSDSWTQKADYPTNSGNYGAITFATSTHGYIGGGATLNGEFFEFDPQTNTWTAIANCPGSPTDQGAFAINDKGYVIQGNLLWEYDPSTDVWTAKQNAPVTFGNWCSGFSIGASGYIKNGVQLYEYKPALNVWMQRASCPGIATGGSVAFIRNGKGYIVGGYSGSLANVTDQVWEYNPGNNTWIQLNDFVGTSRRFSVGFTINNRGYMGTGTNGINFNDFWEMTDAVGIEEETTAAVEVNTFPNPATDQVTFSIANATDRMQVSLYNMSGALVQQQMITNNTCIMQRDALPAGIYFWKLEENGSTVKSGKQIFR